MDRRPPVLAPSALGYGPPVRNWFEEERGSVFLRTLHYLKHNTPKTLKFFLFGKGCLLWLCVVSLLLFNRPQALKHHYFNIQLTYQKLRPYHNNITQVMYVFNMPRAILCSSAWLIGDLSVFPKHL